MAAPETPAELLRRASALMRKRAEAADPGTWTVFFALAATPAVTNGDLTVGEMWGTAGRPMANAQHIASWGPVPAAAVADLLDEVAADRHAELPQRVENAALAIARAYLGENPGG